MKKLIFVLVLLVLALIACDKFKKEQKLNTDEEKFSYLVGVNTAQSLKVFPIEIKKEFLLQGLVDALDGNELKLSEQEIDEVRARVSKQLEKEQNAKNSKIKEENLKKAVEFLAENKKKDGIKETASGLQYEVIKEGEGKTPTLTNIVKVHYKGTTIDGKEFDSSYKRNEPIEFPLNGVIKGWQEGVQLMKKGAQYRFFIKPELAYGENGVPGIEPNSLLIFEVELIDFK